MKQALVLITFLMAVVAEGQTPTPDAHRFWPQWRGPDGTGTALSGSPPVSWSEEENIAWKTEIPGLGSGTPIVWGERLYLLAAIPGESVASRRVPDPDPRGSHADVVPPTHVYRFVLLAVSRADGRILWQKVLHEQQPHDAIHKFGTFASASPFTDGERLYAYFGSNGLYATDMEGNLLWEKDLGDLMKRRGFGEGSTPVLHGDKIGHLNNPFPSFLRRSDGLRTALAEPNVGFDAGSGNLVLGALLLVQQIPIESIAAPWIADGGDAMPHPELENILCRCSLARSTDVSVRVHQSRQHVHTLDIELSVSRSLPRSSLGIDGNARETHALYLRDSVTFHHDIDRSDRRRTAAIDECRAAQNQSVEGAFAFRARGSIGNRGRLFLRLRHWTVQPARPTQPTQQDRCGPSFHKEPFGHGTSFRLAQDRGIYYIIGWRGGEETAV